MTRKFKAIVRDTWKPESPGDTIEGIIQETFRKVLIDDPVPFVSLITDDGECLDVIMGNYTLQKLFNTGELKAGRRLGIEYQGESKHIESHGNKLKVYAFYLEGENGQDLDIDLNKDEDIDFIINSPIEHSERVESKTNKQAKAK